MPELEQINHYKAFVMQGNDMMPTVNNGDFVVADLSQQFIRSGDIYVVEYHNSVIVCRLLLDRNEVTLIFDGAPHQFMELVETVTIIGRVVEIKTNAQAEGLH